jgi:O-antigen/teichoic acid export membrane protein
MRRFLNIDLLIAAALFVLPLMFFWQVTLGTRTLLPADNLYQFQPWAAYRDQLGVPAVPHNSLLSDLVLENLPWKQFIRSSFANGELPLWNPYLFAGVPFLAAGQHSALYPFSVIYYMLPLDKAYGWFTVSQLWLAGFFMFLFVRGLGIGRFGAVIAAIAYQLSSFFIASVVFQMIIAAAAWLPFLLLMVEFTVQQRPLFGKSTVVPWIALGALGLGLEILAGHVEFTYYALLVMGFWSACRLAYTLWIQWRSGNINWRQYIIKPAVSLIMLVVLGIGIGAIQFIPLLELASHNFREGSASFSEVRGYAYPPRHVLAYLMPNVYGSPAQHDYFDMFSGHQTALNWIRADGSLVTDSYWEVNKNYVEGACYVGLLTLFLTAIALLNAAFEKAPHAQIKTAAPYRAILALLSVISVSFIFGTPAYAILYYGLPGINQLHSPFRWVFPLTLCLAVLAGFGAEALQRARGESVFGSQYWRDGAAASFTFRLARILGWALIWIGAAVLLLLALSRIFFERLSGPLDSLFHKLAGADLAFADVKMFYSVEFRPILFFGLFLLGCGCVIRVSRCPIYLPRWRIPVWQPLAIVILAFDLIVASAGFNPAADPAWLSFEPPAITWLKQRDPAQWRFTAVEGPTKTMNANVGWLYGLQDIRGYDSMIPKQYVEYMNRLQPQNLLIYNRIDALHPDQLKTNGVLNPDSELRYLNVNYIVSEIEFPADSGYSLVYQDEAVRIYENPTVLPRVYWVNSATANGQESLDNSAVNPAQIIEARGTQVSVNVTIPDQDKTSGKNYLILSDSYFSGWRVYVRSQGSSEDQEKESAIIRWRDNFRAVELPSGAWTVRFRYSPPSFQVGAFTTFIAAVTILLAVLIWLWQSLYSEGTGEASTARRFAKNSLAPIVLNLFNRGIDFAFAFIMLRILGPTDAGIYYYAIVIFGWFDTLTNFGLNLLLIREVSRDRALARRYLLNSSVLRLGLAMLGIPFLIVFLVIHEITTPNMTTVIAIILLYIGLIPNSISYGLTALFYAFEKAEIPAATTTVIAILKAVFGLAALLAGGGVLGLAAVSILLNLVTFTILNVQARGLLREHNVQDQDHKVVVDRVLMREMIFASWPLMLNNLLAGMFYKIDVTLLEPLKGSAVVGQYSTAYKWLDALGLIPSLFTMALLPIVSRQAKEDKPGLERNYYFAVKLLVTLALPIAVMTTFLAQTLIGLLGGARYLPEGAIALQLMVWFIPIGWINSLTNYVLIALDLQKPMRWAFLAGVIFNIVANILFIPLYSFKAAAIITVLSELVLQIAFYRLLRKSLGTVPWVPLLWKPVAAAGIMGAAMLILWPLNAIVAVVAAGILYPVALIGLRPFSAWELNRVAPLLPRPMRRFIEVQT